MVRIANCSGFYGDRMAAAQGDGRGRADRLPHRRLARRADDADPRRTQGRRRVPRLRAQLHPSDGAGDGHVPRPRHQGRLERRRAEPAVVRRSGRRSVADKLGLQPKIAYIEGDDLHAVPRRPAGQGHHLRQHGHRRAARRSPDPHGQRVHGLLGHRRRARARRRHRHHRTRHRRRRRHGPGRVHARMEARRLGPPRRRARRRTRHRVRRAGDRRQLRVLPGGPRPRASRVPDRRDRRGRLVA